MTAAAGAAKLPAMAEQPSIYAQTPPGALPALFAAAWFLDYIGIGLMMELTYHEFGHAVAAWLSGRYAIPIPIAALTFIGSSRSPIVTLLVAGALAWVWLRSLESRRYGPLLLSTAALLVVVAFAFLVPDQDVQMWCIYAGIGGELVLPAVVITSFYWEMPEELRWGFFRYPVVLSAACGWLWSFNLWSGLSLGLTGWSMRPEDAAIAHSPRAFVEFLANTPGDNDQDCYRLVHTFGWTAQHLTDHYQALALGTFLVIAAVYSGRLFFATPAPEKVE